MAKGPPIHVDVTASRKGSEDVEFCHSWGIKGQPKANSGRIDVPKGQPPTDIKFTLVEDTTGLNLEFYSDPKDAMWVDMAPNCPKIPGDGGQITFQSSNKKILRVEDANSGDPCDLKYALRFYGDTKVIDGREYKPPYEYDPDLKNGGGGIGGITEYSMLNSPLTVVLAFTALVAIGAYLWMR